MNGINSLLNERYEAEYERISRNLFHGKDPGQILSAAAAGDKHLHGEAVTGFWTTKGLQLFYKPRDCQSTDLCGDLTQLLFGERMVPEQAAGTGYAFQKPVKHKLPDTQAAKKNYYDKLGQLTALFYALGSTDMHNGNVLCEGSTPVVIDTETLLIARAKGFAGNGEFSLDYGDVFPDYRTNVGESMVLPRFYGYMQTTSLVPGKDCRPEGYEADFIEGFQDGYRKIIENREGILRILETYQDAPLRVVLRSTQYYSIKIQQYHSAQTDPDRELVLKSLEKGLKGAELIRWKRVLDWERECICEGDVPYFCFLAGARDLYGALNQPALIPDYMVLSPIRYAVWRMEHMCEQDLRVQCAYIRASLKHMDEWIWEDKDKPDEKQTAKEPALLSVHDAVSEVEEALLKLWDERIPLSDGCLWHTPMITGKIGSLFGLAEGFSGIAVFVHACAQSPLITGEPARIAKELQAACFRDLAAFGEYLLHAYPQPPEERVIDRRFNGGFGFADGLSGLLWALNLLRREDPLRTERILEGFQSWQIEDPGEGLTALRNVIREGTVTDCLDGGRAAKALALLLNADSGEHPAEAVREAGAVLKDMVSRKKAHGCFRVYPKGRRSYFLPAFLRGTTGIAWVLLLYAER